MVFGCSGIMLNLTQRKSLKILKFCQGCFVGFFGLFLVFILDLMTQNILSYL